MVCTKETVKASGLNIWSDEAAGRPAPAVDIIAVQGLGSHEFYTWVKKVSSEADKPKRFKDKARFWKGAKTLDKDQADGTTELQVRLEGPRGEVKEEVLGKTHPDTLATMSNLALVLSRQGKYADAEAMNRQTLEISEEVLGKTHPSTLTTMSNLAGVLSSQGKYADAEAMNRQTLEISEEVLGKTHLDTLTSVYCLAHILQNRHKYKEASSLYYRAYTGYQSVLGSDHPTTKACVNNYSVMLKSLEQAK